MRQSFIRLAAAGALALCFCLAGHANAQSVMKQCGEQWQAAKAAGERRMARCVWPRSFSPDAGLSSNPELQQRLPHRLRRRRSLVPCSPGNSPPPLPQLAKAS